MSESILPNEPGHEAGHEAPSEPPTSHPAAPPPSPAPSPAGQPLSNDDVKVWIVLSHLSFVFGLGIVFPILVWLIYRQDGSEGATTVRDHAKEALNFHISIYLYSLACVPLFVILIGIPLLFAIGIFGLVCALIATFKAADFVLFRYPVTLRLL